ncbi:MAG: hypothetical protein OXC65_02500 [Thiotrichales bacterium]|nr:hypothetical protein [Thiotrichales bacterium]
MKMLKATALTLTGMLTLLPALLVANDETTIEFAQFAFSSTHVDPAIKFIVRKQGPAAANVLWASGSGNYVIHGSEAVPNVDYAVQRGVLRFEAGDTEKSFFVRVLKRPSGLLGQVKPKIFHVGIALDPNDDNEINNVRLTTRHPGATGTILPYVHGEVRVYGSLCPPIPTP